MATQDLNYTIQDHKMVLPAADGLSKYSKYKGLYLINVQRKYKKIKDLKMKTYESYWKL